jgi:hypothetical protein
LEVRETAGAEPICEYPATFLFSAGLHAVRLKLPTNMARPHRRHDLPHPENDCGGLRRQATCSVESPPASLALSSLRLNQEVIAFSAEKLTTTCAVFAIDEFVGVAYFLVAKVIRQSKKTRNKAESKPFDHLTLFGQLTQLQIQQLPLFIMLVLWSSSKGSEVMQSWLLLQGQRGNLVSAVKIDYSLNST